VEVPREVKPRPIYATFYGEEHRTSRHLLKRTTQEVSQRDSSYKSVCEDHQDGWVSGMGRSLGWMGHWDKRVTEMGGSMGWVRYWDRRVNIKRMASYWGGRVTSFKFTSNAGYPS